MFDLDMSKVLLVSIVALVVIGPEELPQVLRTLGRAVAKLHGLRLEVQKAATRFMAEAELDKIGEDLAAVETSFRTNIAMNPATAMRASLASSSPTSVASTQILQFASPEMEAYLLDLPASPPSAPAGVTAATSAHCQPAE